MVDYLKILVPSGCTDCATNVKQHSPINSRVVNTREAVLFSGHNLSGSGSYDLGIWQDSSAMSPLPSYTY